MQRDAPSRACCGESADVGGICAALVFPVESLLVVFTKQYVPSAEVHSVVEHALDRKP